MSRKHHEMCKYERKQYESFGFGANDCSCNFRLLIVLILIILQFSPKNHDSNNIIDNSILFIITLFFLSCSNLCKS